SANDFLVVPPVNAAIGKGRMTPDHRPIRHRIGRLQQMRAADLFIALGTQLRDDEIALLIRQEKPIAVHDNEGRRPALLFAAGGNKSLPYTLARIGFEAAELAIAARAVDVAVTDERRCDDTVQRI